MHSQMDYRCNIKTEDLRQQKSTDYGNPKRASEF